jgi:hypothetical protein
MSAHRSRELSESDLRRLRTRSQLLVRSRAKNALDAVTRVVGVQAQDAAAAALGIRARTQTLDARTLRVAIADARSVVKTWTMRGTMHIVSASDVHWLLDLLGHRFAANYRGRRMTLGLTDALLERAIAAIPDVMRATAPVTRLELVQRLVDAGITIATKGQMAAHLVVAASLRGILCCGPDTAAGKSTYVLLNEWIRIAGPKPDDPAAELARRYLAGHGPASVTDFTLWSGLAPATARGAIDRVAHEFESAVVRGEPVWFRDESGASTCAVRLLGGFDVYLLAYKERRFALDKKFQARVHPGGGLIRPIVIVCGRVVGAWRLRNKAVVVDWFGERDYAIDIEAAEVEQFLRSLFDSV